MKKLLTLFKPDPNKTVEENTADFVAELESKGTRLSGKKEEVYSTDPSLPDDELEENYILNALQKLARDRDI
jgi:hypothetical protein